jgi:hypothetical protein
MKVSKSQLRRIIREERARMMEECPDLGSDMPCPIRTAAEMKDAGASPDDVLHWIQLLLSEFAAGPDAHAMVPEEEDEFSFTGDVTLLPGDEAFGIGYEAGTRGLE